MKMKLVFEIVAVNFHTSPTNFLHSKGSTFHLRLYTIFLSLA